MAGGTFAVVGTTTELTLVGVFVAVHSLRKWDGRLEIAVGMAIAARDCLVLAKQREFCLGVIESLKLSDLIPLCRVMT